MDLVQSKLTRSEWNSIEVPVPDAELKIINMIVAGFADPDLVDNDNVTLSSFLKIKPDSDSIEFYLFTTYFGRDVDKITKKYQTGYTSPVASKKMTKINKPDMVRLAQNTYDSISSHRDTIMEYIYIQLIEKFYKHRKTQEKSRWMLYYYTIYHMRKSNTRLNKYVGELVDFVVESTRDSVSVPQIVANFNSYIEKNKHVYKHADRTLYSHQREIFKLFDRSSDNSNNNNNKNKNKNAPRLVLYIAPTSTGKTLTPIGLSEKYRVIFVCAARHVGINLAKAAISAGKKVAFGFGCESAADIRLHYFAASEHVRRDKDGSVVKYRDGSKKVDNSVGDKVEIMICDIQSYKYAMYYMRSFNPEMPDDSSDSTTHTHFPIITFWDEPTITMDYEDHPCHKIIESNWTENIISNVVLSSATLPKEHEIDQTIRSFRMKFGDDASVHSIVSHDCKKTIPLYDTMGHVVVPHTLYDDYRDLLRCVAHVRENPTLLRYFDLDSVSEFISYANDHQPGDRADIFTDPKFRMENVFPDLGTVSVQNIKLYYLDILENVRDDMWSEIHDHFKARQKILLPGGGVMVTSNHAATLSEGPTIFITEEPEKIAKFYLNQAKIPKEHLANINTCIEFNNAVNRKMSDLEKTLEDKLQKYEGMEKKLANTDTRGDPEIRDLGRKIDGYRGSIRSVKLPDEYVPNTRTHIEKFHDPTTLTNAPFAADIGDDDVERIMAINGVDDIWKVLLIMGVGLFSQTNNIAYTEIVKELAEKQRLYLIIAKGDYIYGTNYQFCHGFLSKDLTNMTQEKIIQAIGRIGRSDVQKQYSVRFRNNDMIRRLFREEEDKVEVRNMNALFC
jgi:hypothetical protein